MTEKEKDLLAGCLAGEKAAWDAFVVQYSGLIYHTIKKTFSLHHADPRTELVDDLYQDLFVAIVRDDFKKLRQFRGDRGCTLASWLRLLAVRLTIDFLRRQEPAGGEPTDEPSEDPEPWLPQVSQEDEKALSQAIEALPPRDKILLDLCFRHGLPPQEIAAILRISTNAVYTRKSRLLSKLREILRLSDSV